MKLNKTVALMAVLASGLLVSGGLQAQDTAPAKPSTPPASEVKPLPPGGGMRQAMNPEKLAKDLGLNEEQTTKLKDALQERRQKMTDLRADTSIAQEAKRAKAKEIMDAANAKLKVFMTPEQYEKYLKMVPGPRNRPGAGAPGAAAPLPTPDKPAAAPQK